MIKHNKLDKFLSPLVKDINSSELLRNMKNPRILHIYGVQSTRTNDVVIPNAFPYVNSLSKLFQSKGLKVGIGSFWDLAETYNFKVIGLGHNIRKSNPEACKKIIMCSFMALNNMIQAEETEPANHF